MPYFPPDINSTSPGRTVTVSGNYIADVIDNTILVDTSPGNAVITIIDPALLTQGKQVRVKKNTTDTNTMTIQATNSTIEGQASFSTNAPLRSSYTLEVTANNTYIFV